MVFHEFTWLERRQFEQNLACLHKHHANLFSLFSETEILFPVFEPGNDSESIRVFEKEISSDADFFYILGLDAGKPILESAPKIVKENRGILVIEPSSEWFAMILHHYDYCSLFRNKKIFWAVGSDYENWLQRILDQTLCFAAARPFFFCKPSAYCPERSSLLSNVLGQIRREVIRKKSDLYECLKNLASRVGIRKDRPTRIWSFDDFRGKSRYSIIQSVLIRNLFYGLKKIGYETEYTVLQDGYYYPPYYRILKMALFEPDLIFLCNQGPAYEMSLGAELSRSLPIPKVTWFADDPIYAEHLLLRHKITPDETYLVADYEWVDPLIENGASPPSYMPGAATHTRRGKKRSSRVCDIVFVGQVRDQRAFFESLSPAWKAYCQKVVMEKLRYPRKKVREVMAQFPMPGYLAADRMDELRQKILWEANTRFRMSVITSLSDYDLRIYGNEAWVALLPPSLAQRCFRGVVRFKHLPEVYRNARITLNIHSLQSYTCLNVRDFDVPVAGGFLLSDWLPRAEEVVRPGYVGDLPLPEDYDREIFFYRTLPELKQLANYFLEHEEQRHECTERARRRILSEHTYSHRAQWLHELFQSIRNTSFSSDP